MIETPYLLFLGDAPDPLAAKVAQGIKDWRPEYAIGQLRLPGCNADMGLPDLTLAEARAKGVKTLVIGVANRGGIISTFTYRINNRRYGKLGIELSGRPDRYH